MDHDNEGPVRLMAGFLFKVYSYEWPKVVWVYSRLSAWGVSSLDLYAGTFTGYGLHAQMCMDYSDSSMKNIKMVVTDMDGTLLDSQKRLPQNFDLMYNQLRERGIRFVVASGRQYYTLENEFRAMDHDICFIAENGGIIVFDGHTHLLRPIRTAGLERLIRHIRAIEGAEIVLCGKESAYVESASEGFVRETMKYYHRCSIVDDLLEVDDQILKVAVNDMVNLESSTLASVQTFAEDFHISTSSQIWLDIMPKGVNKGEGLKYLKDHLGLNLSDVMAFGDYLNDYEMLELVGHSYAMGNAHEDVKKVSRYVTKSNDENGVMEVLSGLLHVKG